MYEGNLWAEVMLLGGVNDSSAALGDISAVLRRVEPDEIHISTPTRPPAEPWVELPSREGIERASAIFGSVAKVLQPVDVVVDSGIDGEIADAALTIVSRHPMQEAELIQALACWAPRLVIETLIALENSGKIKVIKRYGKRFWCSADILFPDGRLAGNPPRKQRDRQTLPGLPV
jgi:hypothetical protein